VPADALPDVGPPTLDELHNELLDRGAARALEPAPLEPPPPDFDLADMDLGP
jgi:hypothetical protein